MPDPAYTSVVALELARRAPLEAEIDRRASQHGNSWAGVYAALAVLARETSPSGGEP